MYPQDPYPQPPPLPPHPSLMAPRPGDDDMPLPTPVPDAVAAAGAAPEQASPSAPTGAVLAVHSGRVLRGALAGLPSGMPPAT